MERPLGSKMGGLLRGDVGDVEVLTKTCTIMVLQSYGYGVTE
jgi:hypothetical protein